MKVLLRIIIISLIALLIFMLASPGELTEELNNEGNMSLGLILLKAWLIVTSLASLYFWIYMFYHWRKSSFKKPHDRTAWFWVILVGGMMYLMGAIVYYVLVVEKGVGLTPKPSTEN